jgi:hypothetical protein
VDPKKLEIEVIEILDLFLVGCFDFTNLTNLFSYFSNFFASIT